MTKFEIKSKLVRLGEIALNPKFAFKLFLIQMRAKLRNYKRNLETERSWIAPNGWEYRKGYIGTIYLWPVGHNAPE